MTKPLVEKFFPLRGFKPKGVQVVLWATGKDLTENTCSDGHEASLKASGRKNEESVWAMGGHQPNAFYISDKSSRVSGKTNVVSTLHFTVEMWGFEIITHELMHLVFWMIPYFGIEALVNFDLQEKWCYALGELSEQIAYFIKEQDDLYTKQCDKINVRTAESSN